MPETGTEGNHLPGGSLYLEINTLNHMACFSVSYLHRYLQHLMITIVAVETLLAKEKKQNQ